MVTITRTHVTELHDISWNGVSFNQGLAKDTYITFTRNAESIMADSDAGGQSRSRSRIGDLSGTVEITLQQQSSFNQTLMGILASTENGGDEQEGDFKIKAGGTLFIYQPKQCVISKAPEQSIGQDISSNTVTWTFDSAYMPLSDLDDLGTTGSVRASIEGNIKVAVGVNVEI